MEIQISMKEDFQINEALSNNKMDVCQSCENIYLIIRFKQGENYNDFGDRYCPFCGLQTEEFCIAVSK